MNSFQLLLFITNNLSSDLLKHDEIGNGLYSNFIKNA